LAEDLVFIFCFVYTLDTPMCMCVCVCVCVCGWVGVGGWVCVCVCGCGWVGVCFQMSEATSTLINDSARAQVVELCEEHSHISLDV